MTVAEVEAILGRRVTLDEMWMLARMDEKGKSAAEIAATLAEPIEIEEPADDELPVERFAQTIDGTAARF